VLDAAKNLKQPRILYPWRHLRKMTFEEIIQQILLQHPEVTRKAVLERLRVEKGKTGGLIADATLLRMIAAEYGIEIPSDTVYDSKLSISHLVPNLNDVAVSGRVVAVYPAKTFGGKRPGKYASLIIVDADSVLRVMLWNDKADLVESDFLKTGQVARFSHCYTREDRNGKVELHLGDKSEVDVNPQDLQAENYPDIGRFATQIKEIREAQGSVNLVGVVRKVFPSSTFTRQDSTTGKVLRFTLADDSGEVTVVVWNEKADELEMQLKRNMTVELVNGMVKAASNGGFEVHVGASAYVGVSAVAVQVAKIAGLRGGMRSVCVEGEVVVAPVSREVETGKGEVVKLAVFELRDDTGAVRVSAWREHAEAVGGLKVGDYVRLVDVSVKKGFGDVVELATRSASVVAVV
jgi:ssDNA-binding replication factor A large subunit